MQAQAAGPRGEGRRTRPHRARNRARSPKSGVSKTPAASWRRGSPAGAMSSPQRGAPRAAARGDRHR
jgi:hypothetical protein